MLKNKIVTHSLCTMLCVAAPLAVAVTPGHAWDVHKVDYETNNEALQLTKPYCSDITSDAGRELCRDGRLTDGEYLETGGWVSYTWPGTGNGGYRYLSASVGNRHGMALWNVKIPKAGLYKIESSYRASENRTTKADYFVYVNTSTTDVRNKTATTPPVGKKSFSQRGNGPTTTTIGEYCLKQNDISMLVLDGDDGQSDSSDATTWTFVGSCGGNNITPIHKLLLKRK